MTNEDIISEILDHPGRYSRLVEALDAKDSSWNEVILSQERLLKAKDVLIEALNDKINAQLNFIKLAEKKARSDGYDEGYMAANMEQL